MQPAGNDLLHFARQDSQQLYKKVRPPLMHSFRVSKAMGFEMKVKTICRPLLFIFDSTCLQYFGIRRNAMGKPDVPTDHGAVANGDPS